MKDIVDEVFAQVIELLIEEGLVHLQDYFLDGTKIDSKANKYTFVWKKSIDKNRSKLENKIRELISQIDYLNDKENKEYGDKDLEELGGDEPISSEKIDDLARRINERIAENEKKKEKRKKNKPQKIKKIKKVKKKLKKEY